jgi:hypothetical protein
VRHEQWETELEDAPSESDRARLRKLRIVLIAALLVVAVISLIV